MAAVVGTSKRSAAGLAASRTMDAEMDAVLAGKESRFGDQVAFMGDDLATPERIREHHTEGYAVVIVDEHGNERFLPVP